MKSEAPDVPFKMSCGEAPLHQTVCWIHVIVLFIFLLLSPPADPVSYYNPLHISVLRSRPNMVRLLVGHGADIEKRDRVRRTATQN